ncbi:MAG: hypothetical protein LBG81_05685 [Coriobacteriaceae bacterium]|jgi:hypothetical protein|nr:hypothetical protein [Coriobacteriaceae bacterium]
MGGRGARSASGKMFDRLPDQKMAHLMISNEQPAKGEIMRAFIIAKLKSVEDNPKLEGQIYKELHSVTMADMSGRTLGVYAPGLKRIIVKRGLDPAEARATVAHELGHALAVKPPPGFRSDVAAFESAFKQYKKANPRASETSFSARISNYATNSRGEAFAEAFKDVSVNGKKAKPESKLILKHWKE